MLRRGSRALAVYRANFADIASRRFPDGESLVRVSPGAGDAILYRSLNDPNEKLVELLLAASALRDGGADRVILIAPYLGYMRQDTAFHAGEAVSQRVIGGLLAAHFDGVITIDPHLHRVGSLAEVISGVPALALTAAGDIAESLRGHVAAGTVLVGPDAESRQWVERVARPLGLDVLVGEKMRRGDRQVELAIPGVEQVRGRCAVLIDDVISSGATLTRCAALLRDAGATRVEAIATHCLANAKDLRTLAAAKIDRIRSTATVPGPIATIPIVATLARGVSDVLAACT